MPTYAYKRKYPFKTRATRKKRKGAQTVRPTKWKTQRRARRVKYALYSSLLAPKLRSKLVYCDTKHMAQSNSAQRHLFNLTSIFDPQWAVGGHQPAFRDNFAALYLNYRVLGCKFTLRFRPTRDTMFNDGGAGQPYSDATANDMQRNQGLVFWELRGGVGADVALRTETADLNGIRESGNRRTDVKFRSTTASPTRSYVMSGYMRPREHVHDPVDALEAVAMGGNPTISDTVILHVGKMPESTTYLMGDFKVDIKLEYYVEFTNPLDSTNQN